MDTDSSDDSNYFGVWPAIVGLAFAALITWVMFKLADGFL